MARVRPKLDLTPITYEEVVESSALKGMVSFLEVAPGGLPVLDFSGPARPFPPPQVKPLVPSNQGLPEKSTPVTTRLSGALEIGVPEVDIELTAGIPVKGIPVSGAVVSGIAFKGALDTALPVPGSFSFKRSAVRIRKATLAQDGHSYGEQALYDALWRHAHPAHGKPTGRMITIGYRGMAEIASLTVNNSKLNIRALEAKLAVESVAGFSHTHGRTYLIFSYEGILQRRRESGLTHYVKNRGVQFVDPDTGSPLVSRFIPKHSMEEAVPETGIPYLNIGTPEAALPPLPVSSELGVPESAGYPYRNSARQTLDTSSSLAQLASGLRQIVSSIDDDAIGLLCFECRRRVPDCTTEEILHFTRFKATLCRQGRILNPVGFLLSSVPKCFEGAAFAQFRKDQQRGQQELQAEMEALRRGYEKVLADPGSTEEDRQLARRMLNFS